MGITIEMAAVSLLLVRDPLLESVKVTSRACQRLLIRGSRPSSARLRRRRLYVKVAMVEGKLYILLHEAAAGFRQINSIVILDTYATRNNETYLLGWKERISVGR